MPNRTIYVREDDIEAFDAIEDRPEWLHRAILEIPNRPIPGLAKALNIKQNEDGTISPIDPKKPASFETNYIGIEELP